MNVAKLLNTVCPTLSLRCPLGASHWGYIVAASEARVYGQLDCIARENKTKTKPINKQNKKGTKEQDPKGKRKSLNKIKGTKEQDPKAKEKA